MDEDGGFDANAEDSNKADLRLLEEMGITPDRTIREKKPSLRTVGWMVVATVRMKRMQESWAANRQLHQSLMKKLEEVRKRRGKRAILR